ncbi:hypothetical protein KYC5002_48550 [Archangium violaceum]|uniref:hypothetical protein n=1 Tax=Archangium violaceum TaxID=83451 RepID=UPI002B2F9B3F|nr:hypothetical protein KYC5002_48550 [Archangium gephyra]
MTWRWLADTTGRTKFRGCALALALGMTGLALPAAAQSTPLPGAYAEWQEAKERTEDAPAREFVLINYFFTRVTASNQLGDPAGLRGVSLGPIGFPAGSAVRVEKRTAFFVEQRWIPVIEYSPIFVDGMASFRAQFEVDYLWGRAANTVQQNEGGGFNADQINIQTKNVNVALYPTKDPNQLTLLFGTQPVYDSVHDPTRAPLGDIIRTGYKLTFLGSDATGLSVFSNYLGGQARLSLMPLGSFQADKATDDDPRLKFVWTALADYTYPLAPGTNVGLSLWHLRDDTKGEAYAFEGLVRSGPGSPGLGSFTGAPQFAIERPSGWVTWLGANFNHNIDFRTGPFGASGFVMYNAGRFRSNRPDTTLNRQVDISGLSANLELLYNFGRTSNDLVTLEGMFSTGDSDLRDGRYTSAFTFNEYGLPGAVWFNHKMLILFPFTSTVNNYTGAVTDISNQGFGLQSVVATGAYDLIPNKLNLKLGVGHARSSVTPPENTPGIPRGRIIGTEINAELRYTIRYLMTVGLHGGYMFRGAFYNGNPRVTENPWAAFTTFTWYAF